MLLPEGDDQGEDGGVHEELDDLGARVAGCVPGPLSPSHMMEVGRHHQCPVSSGVATSQAQYRLLTNLLQLPL